MFDKSILFVAQCLAAIAYLLVAWALENAHYKIPRSPLASDKWKRIAWPLLWLATAVNIVAGAIILRGPL